MKLFEHEAKIILSKYQISTPKGAVATSPMQAEEIAKQLKSPYVVKAQMLVAGRGKAGGIQFANTPPQVKFETEKLLNTKIKGIQIKSVLVEEKISIKRELYFGFTVDRANKCYVAIASPAGGIDIEEIAATTPEKIVKTFVDPLIGFRSYHGRQIAKKLGYNGGQMLELARIFQQLYCVALDYDVELVEMNPLVETSDGKFVAADARIIIDDNSLYRHPDFSKRFIQDVEAEFSPQEMEALKSGLAYVKLDGNIGVIGNGAGLVMATLDAIQLQGGKPANFLDVGGGATAEQMSLALNVVLSNPQVEVVFINILGGITRCDEIAKGILEAKKRVGFTKPMVIRLVGTNEREGREILMEAGIHVLDSMEEAAQKAAEIVGTGG